MNIFNRITSNLQNFWSNFYDATHNEDPTKTLQYKAVNNISTPIQSVFSNIQQWGKQLSDIAMQHSSNVVDKGYNQGYIDLWSMIKAKHPQYSDISDEELGRKIVAKYPQYQDIVTKWSWISSNPISGSLASIESWLSKWVWTFFGGISDIGSAPLQDTWTAGITRFAKGALETGLWAAQTATSIMPTATWVKALVAPTVNTLFSTDTAWKVIQPVTQWIEKGIWMGQSALGFDPNSSVSKDIQNIGGTLGTTALFAWAQKWASKAYDVASPYVKNIEWKIWIKVSDIRNSISEKNANKAKAMTDEWLKEIYEAVNPTTRENKAVLRKRVDDLLPYIDETKRFANDLETVKWRVDADKTTAFKSMENFENNVWVKGRVNTTTVAKEIANKYQEKIGKSYINADEARMAQQLIDTLKWFWKTVNDADIIKVRRAWDKIIEKNKGFMQSAEATSKGDIFADANRFFREEIKRSNPEYAKFLEKAHKTITLSDILDATIQRRTGQTQGGFIRKASENTARVVGTGLWTVVWGIPWAFVWAAATEWLLAWVNKLTGSSSKLTKWKNLILKSQKNGTSNNNIPDSRTSDMVGKSQLVTSWPRLVKKPVVTPVKVSSKNDTPIIKRPTNESKVIKPSTGDTIPEGYFKNAFWEIQKLPSNKKGGFIKIPEIGKKSEIKPEIEKYLKTQNIYDKKQWEYGTILKKLSEEYSDWKWWISDEWRLLPKYKEAKKNFDYYFKLLQDFNWLESSKKASKEFNKLWIVERQKIRRQINETKSKINVNDDSVWLGSDSNKSIPVKNPLVEEARKYKSWRNMYDVMPYDMREKFDRIWVYSLKHFEDFYKKNITNTKWEITMYRWQSKPWKQVQFNDTKFQWNTDGWVFFTPNKDIAKKYWENIIELKSNKNNTLLYKEAEKLQKMAEKMVSSNIKNGITSKSIIEQMALWRPKAFAEYTKKPFLETWDMFWEQWEMIYYKNFDNK